MDKYKIIKTVGDGTYGTVAKAINRQDGKEVAIKKMKQKFKTWDECMSLREIKALRKLNHHNIIKLREVLRVVDDLYLVFDFMENNVYEMMRDAQKDGGFSEQTVKSFLY
jgi:serine/threonine protein kinase